MNACADMAGRNARGWRAVLGCGCATFWSGALVFGYPGVVGGYWQTHLNGGTGAVMTIVLLSLGVGTLVCGRLHEKTGTRNAFLIGTIVQMLGMPFVIYAHTMQMVWAWAFMTGFASCFLYAPGLTTVQSWFPDRRGLVTGIVNVVFGCSGAVMAPVFQLLLEQMGYVRMNWIIAGLVFLTNVGAICLAEMPQRSKMTEGEREAHRQMLENIARGNMAKAAVDTLGASMTARQALKTRAFWQVWLIWALMGAAGISMVSLCSGYSLHLGIAGVMAVTAFNLTNGLSRIVAGALSDRIGRRRLGFFAYLLGGVGYFALPFADALLPLCILTACVGIAFGTHCTIGGPLVSDLFGLEHFGAIFGLVFTAYGFVGGIVGPLLSDVVLKVSGSYTPVFFYLAFFCVFSAALVLGAKRRQNG